MDIRVYERVQDGRVSFDVYVINADSGNKHAGGMPKRWLIFHCATIGQIKAKLPQVNIAINAKKGGKKVVQGSSEHPNPDAFKKIEIRYIVDQLNKTIAAQKDSLRKRDDLQGQKPTQQPNPKVTENSPDQVGNKTLTSHVKN